MRDETRNRIVGELQRIRCEIANCAHCESLRQQYARLSILLPPEPIEVNGSRYVFTPPKEYEDLVERTLEDWITREPR